MTYHASTMESHTDSDRSPEFRQMGPLGSWPERRRANLTMGDGFRFAVGALFAFTIYQAAVYVFARRVMGHF